MPPQKDPITVRTVRLNNFILGKGNSSNGKGNTRRSVGGFGAAFENLSRDTLLDAISVLYHECDKETLKKRDKNVAEFVNKCKCPELRL